MKSDEIYNEWQEFVKKHQKYLMSYEERWRNTLNIADNIITASNLRPSKHSKDPELKQIGIWLVSQAQTYTKKTKIMQFEHIRKEWQEFIEKHKKFFVGKDEEWDKLLADNRKYLIKNKKRASVGSSDKTIQKLGMQLSHQVTNVTNGILQKTQERYKKWLNFTEEFSEYFKDQKNEMTVIEPTKIIKDINY